MSNKVLTKFTKAAKAVAKFKEDNEKVFDDYNSLLLRLQNAETELKKEVKENVKETIANDFVQVTYTRAWRKWYDSDIIIGGVTPRVKKQMVDEGVIVTKTTIEKIKLELFVNSGKVPADVKQAAFNEKEMSPRITIKENK